MKKSLVSLVTAMLVLGAAAGASYALFTDRAQVNGLSISTGNADLKIGNNEIEPGEHDQIDYPENDLLSNVYPGYVIGDKFRLINRSDSNIRLMVSATLKEFDGDWADLKHKILADVVEYESALQAEEDSDDTTPKDEGTIITSTGWQTMQWWANNSPEIVTAPIDQDAQRHFVLWIKVDESAGDEIAGKAVDLNIEFNGTQVLE